MAEIDARGSAPAHGVGPDTIALLERAKRGEAAARDALAARFLPRLRRWASGRLPGHARSQVDTDDLVQVTLVRALGRLESFEVRNEGSFLAYLKQIVLNQIRDELRRPCAHQERGDLGEVPSEAPSPIEEVIGAETLARYEAALAGLPASYREAVTLRVEFGLSFEEMAQAMGKPSANAARLLLTRALVQLAKRMHERRTRA